jgi:hypothetical protein
MAGDVLRIIVFRKFEQCASYQHFCGKIRHYAKPQNVIGNPYKTKIKPLTKFDVQRFELKETI